MCYRISLLMFILTLCMNIALRCDNYFQPVRIFTVMFTGAVAVIRYSDQGHCVKPTSPQYIMQVSGRSLTFIFLQNLNRLSDLQSQTLSHGAPEAADHCEEEKTKFNFKRSPHLIHVNTKAVPWSVCPPTSPSPSNCPITAA